MHFAQENPQLAGDISPACAMEQLFYRLKLLPQKWRLYSNEDFKLCNSYPRKIIVPLVYTAEEVNLLASMRIGHVLPILAFEHAPSKVWKGCATLLRNNAEVAC